MSIQRPENTARIPGRAKMNSAIGVRMSVLAPTMDSTYCAKNTAATTPRMTPAVRAVEAAIARTRNVDGGIEQRAKPQLFASQTLHGDGLGARPSAASAAANLANLRFLLATFFDDLDVARVHLVVINGFRQLLGAHFGHATIVHFVDFLACVDLLLHHIPHL